jgi:L-alanine-DL-glutamate epimerase-like enolase superfamily enzyme
MVAAAQALEREGYQTLKVKIGRNVDEDIVAAKALLDTLPEDLRLRFDANEAYDAPSAERFLLSLDHPRRHLVELVEQPLPRKDWDAMARLCSLSPVPLMLDEAIDTKADIDRAAAIGTQCIKLKLFKNGAPSDLLVLAGHACGLGLRVILGNGVSSDIGCLMEGWAYASRPDLFFGAGEMNGFVKTRRPMLTNPPELRDGKLHWQRDTDSCNPISLR